MVTVNEFLSRKQKILDTPKPDWFEFFLCAYYDLREGEYAQLVKILQDAFIPTGLWDEIEKVRENVTYYVLSKSIEDWLENTNESAITFLTFRKSYLNNYLGYGPFVLREYLKDNISEFDVTWEDTDPTGVHSHIIKRIIKI
jgi:hypothetical protein